MSDQAPRLNTGSALSYSSPMILKIKETWGSFHPSEQMVAEFVTSHLQEATFLTINQLAHRSGVSEATVMRFCRQLGYDGFKGFKEALARELITPERPPTEPSEDPFDALKYRLFSQVIATLQDVAHILDTATLRRAAEALAGAERVMFYAIGGSGQAARLTAAIFMYLGMDAVASDDMSLARISAAFLGPGCVAVGVSLHGDTPEVVEALIQARRMGSTTICVTNSPTSPLATVSDIGLFTSLPLPQDLTDPQKQDIVTSAAIAQFAILRVLAIAAWMVRKGELAGTPEPNGIASGPDRSQPLPD